jgi:hypothetical protein
MCVMSPSAGTGAGGVHLELCVPTGLTVYIKY